MTDNRKLFTLIDQSDITIEPGTKILPKEELGIALSSKELIECVKKDAAAYKKRIVEESEVLRKQAAEEGFAEGFKKWAEKLAELEEEIKKAHNEIEKVVLPLALKAAKKIVNQEITTSEQAILNIIRNQLQKVAQHKKIAIYVNPNDFEIVEKEREQLKTLFENLEALSIRKDKDIERGGTIIETEGGIINAQLANQWLILENAFQKMLLKENKKGSND